MDTKWQVYASVPPTQSPLSVLSLIASHCIQVTPQGTRWTVETDGSVETVPWKAEMIQLIKENRLNACEVQGEWEGIVQLLTWEQFDARCQEVGYAADTTAVFIRNNESRPLSLAKFTQKIERNRTFETEIGTISRGFCEAVSSRLQSNPVLSLKIADFRDNFSSSLSRIQSSIETITSESTNTLDISENMREIVTKQRNLLDSIKNLPLIEDNSEEIDRMNLILDEIERKLRVLLVHIASLRSKKPSKRPILKLELVTSESNESFVAIYNRGKRGMQVDLCAGEGEDRETVQPVYVEVGVVLLDVKVLGVGNGEVISLNSPSGPVSNPLLLFLPPSSPPPVPDYVPNPDSRLFYEAEKDQYPVFPDPFRPS